MFGFFGKGVLTQPAPGQATLPDQPILPSTTPTTADEPIVISPIVAPEDITTKPAMDPESQQIRAHLDMVRREIEAQKAEKEAQIRALREKQAKQAAYGRDTVQKRPPKAGYATEAEKIMGGNTGYFTPPAAPGGFGYFGTMQTLTQDVNTASDDVAKALAIVKQVSKDVKAGVSPRSDLKVAIADLEAKVRRTKQLSDAAKGLSGYGEAKKHAWWILPAIIVLFYFGMKKLNASKVAI